jgi:hypothetical protein
MPPWTKMLDDQTIGGEKLLRMARGLEPSHAPLPLTGGLVGVLRPIVQIPVLAVFYPWQELALGSSIAFEFIGDNHTGDVAQSFEELAEKLLCRLLIPSPLHQDIQHVPLLSGQVPLFL